MNPGAIVSCRNREWVLLPSDDDAIYRLRPLTGAIDDVVAVHRGLTNLVGSLLPSERVASATFPLPTTADIADAGSAHLLWQAARLTLREGATPFRSFGRISVRPRVYQLVPLLMGLRLDPVRLFIADDVGVGKTIEALLIARELLDRGEIRRMCVLAPPSLCDQWQTELSQKTNLDAVVIRSGTVGQLERRKASTESIYRYYPIQVASIDFLKSDRNRHLFLQDCPDLVIVDEVHGAADATSTNRAQQQRHELLRDIAARNQHLILLTATPHSGVDAAFRSLLALLNPEFGQWDPGTLDEERRKALARHFVQRTRKDIETHWEGEHCFPTREPKDETYALSARYRQLFDETYGFCSDMVRTGATLDRRRQRIRYWGALALLRCVMSSPAAAMAALEARHVRLAEAGADDVPDFAPLIFESSDERTDDEQPLPAVEAAEATLAEGERRRLRQLARLAAAIEPNGDDTKLARVTALVSSLLAEGFHPIVWCRYIATARHVGQALARALSKRKSPVQVTVITSLTGDDEVRRAKINEISADAPRVLVATDCLSEGINLQDRFNAAIHYDLPWNPNRLEQREGRVDRFGQPSKTVRTVRFYGADNPVDGVVIDVLLNKAREIHAALGTHVPVPEEGETVTQAVLNALFLRGRPDDRATQLRLDLGGLPPEVEALHARWARDAERERVNRTRFAQRAIKPEEIRRELEATDSVLGDPDAVREFVLSAAQRLNVSVTPDKRRDVFRVSLGAGAVAALPDAVRFALPSIKAPHWTITFSSPSPEGAEYLGRNHTFVGALARFLMEEALTRHGAARASRCGVLGTSAVDTDTTLLLLRARYLVEQPGRPALLSEEVLVTGYRLADRAAEAAWLDDGEALRLLVEARPDTNVEPREKTERAQAALDRWPAMLGGLRPKVEQRAADLAQSHKRIRQAVQMRVRELRVVPQMPPDLLGILVLRPFTAR